MRISHTVSKKWNIMFYINATFVEYFKLSLGILWLKWYTKIVSFKWHIKIRTYLLSSQEYFTLVRLWQWMLSLYHLKQQSLLSCISLRSCLAKKTLSLDNEKNTSFYFFSAIFFMTYPRSSGTQCNRKITNVQQKLHPRTPLKLNE